MIIKKLSCLTCTWSSLISSCGRPRAHACSSTGGLWRIMGNEGTCVRMKDHGKWRNTRDISGCLLVMFCSRTLLIKPQWRLVIINKTAGPSWGHTNHQKWPIFDILLWFSDSSVTNRIKHWLLSPLLQFLLHKNTITLNKCSFVTLVNVCHYTEKPTVINYY